MSRWVIGAAVALLAGCIGTEDFDPVGDVASVSGSWTIDGARPTEVSCDALGASVVQITFLDMLRPVTHTGLRFECSFSDCGRDACSFDTDQAGGSGAVVAASDTGLPWRFRYEAVDSTGTVLAVSDTYQQTIVDPGDGMAVALDIPPYDFSTATASASFVVAGASPTVASCEEAGIASVELAFDPADGVRTDSSEPCVVGSVGARLRLGDYTARLVVVRTDGSRAESEPVSFSVGAGQQVTPFGAAAVELTSIGS